MGQEECINIVPIFARNLSILLVDNDEHSLTSLASMLEHFPYKVTTTVSTALALSMLQQQKHQFKLVMANVNMYDSGSVLFLHQLVKERIPVVPILSNNDINAAAKGLVEGLSFCLEKPISLTDLKNIWQHAFRSGTPTEVKEIEDIDVMETISMHCSEKDQSKGKKLKHANIMSEATVIVNHLKISSHNQTQIDPIWRNAKITCGVDQIQQMVEESEVIKRKFNEENDREKNHKKLKSVMVDGDLNIKSNVLEELQENELRKKGTKDCESSKSKRRPRVVWTTELHLKFTAALSSLGDTRARPKSILQKMNVPYLTQRQVASHLQKYKAQVQRITEIAATDTSSLMKIPYDFYTRDDAFHQLDTIEGTTSQQCGINPCFGIGNICNLSYDSYFSSMPIVPLHPNNVEDPIFAEPYHGGFCSFKEENYSLNDNIIGDIDCLRELAATLQSEGDDSSASIVATSTSLLYDTPILESLLEMETPNYLVDPSTTDNVDLFKLSDEGSQILKGLCNESNLDDSNEYMEWLVDVPENNSNIDG